MQFEVKPLLTQMDSFPLELKLVLQCWESQPVLHRTLGLCKLAVRLVHIADIPHY